MSNRTKPKGLCQHIREQFEGSACGSQYMHIDIRVHVYQETVASGKARQADAIDESVRRGVEATLAYLEDTF